jgi:hypothetical protein
MAEWSFEADYFTVCNCDWGCPCNFDARPTEGRCMGLSAWNITTGRFGETRLDDTRFAVFYSYPGLVSEGQGTACTYIDSSATKSQQDALEEIGSGRAGGGIFELFGQQLVTTWLRTKIVPIEFGFRNGAGRVRIEGFVEAESELLSYPDGTVILPEIDLPHGIEFKKALMTNASHWSIHDADLLANYHDKYGAVARVKFTQDGCVA